MLQDDVYTAWLQRSKGSMELGQSDRVRTLLSWRDQVRKELAELRERQSRLGEEVSKKDGQLRSILALLESEGYAEGRSIASGLDPNGSIADCAYSVLRESGQPTYYKDLAARIMEMGISIPGKDAAANLLSHIGRDDRFQRVKRGTYALTEWKVPKQKKRGGNRRRTGSAKGSPVTPRQRSP